MKNQRRSLLDVNFLLALLDKDHIHHRRAVDWLGDHVSDGWASCPITQNGCIRIMSNPRYQNPTSVQDAVRRLSKATNTYGHEFWPDSISLFKENLIAWSKVVSCRSITDTYLLALAVENDGRFVTFDRGISIGHVDGVQAEHLEVIRI